MKLLMSIALVSGLFWFVANAQLGPQNLPGTEKAEIGLLPPRKKESTNQFKAFGDSQAYRSDLLYYKPGYRPDRLDYSHSYRPEEVPGLIPPTDGLTPLRELVASQKQTIEVQRQEIHRLTQELSDCQSKLSH
jgi:hypothetical protein